MATLWRYPLQPVENAAGTAVTATSLTSLLGGIPLPQLPPVYAPSGRLVIEAQMEHTSTSATPTLTLTLAMGSIGQAIGSKTVIAASAALAISASAASWPIMLYYSGRFRTLSPTAGVIYGQGYILQGTSLTVFAAAAAFPVTQALRTVSTLNTDQTNEVDLGATWSSATGTPTITLTDFSAELSG